MATHRIIHPKYGEAIADDHQLSEFRSLGWQTEEEAEQAAAKKKGAKGKDTGDGDAPKA